MVWSLGLKMKEVNKNERDFTPSKHAVGNEGWGQHCSVEGNVPKCIVFVMRNHRKKEMP